MDSRGIHIILEVFDWKSDDLELVKDVFIDSCGKMGANILQIADYKFEEQGLTMIVLLSESHLSIHTYPECNYCAIDCFTCGSIDAMVGINNIINKFNLKDYKIQIINRGIK